jgi:hypothetical protein
MGTMMKNPLPAPLPPMAPPGKPQADGLQARADSALSECQAARYQLGVFAHESRQLRDQIHHELGELRIGRMKHSILVAEIKLHCLKGSAICSVHAIPEGASEPRPYGRLIQ